MSNDTFNRQAGRLRITGVIVMVLGLAGAGLVYWIRTRSANMNDDVSMLGFNRAEHRQMGMLYGSMGSLMDDWFNDLKQPGTQAILIMLGSLLIAVGCFYFARLLDHDDEPL